MQGSQASTYHQRRVALDRLQPSVPARYYYDPQHYERELEAAYPRRPFGVLFPFTRLFAVAQKTGEPTGASRGNSGEASKTLS